MRKLIEIIDKATDVVFTDEWQERAICKSLNYLSAGCAIMGLFNPKYFILSAILFVALYNKKK